MTQQLFPDEPAPQAPALGVPGPDALPAGEASSVPSRPSLPVQAARAGTPPADGDRRVRLTVAYDGAAFHGFASNVGVATVQGTLERSLARVLRRPEVAITGAGRTDTGVHAWGQVVTFDAPLTTDLGRLQRSDNGMCGPAVVVREAAWAADDFDARFSAQWRHYRYTVLNTPWPSPFLTSTAWHVSEPLDLAALRLACDPFVGEHDFSSFCKRPKPMLQRDPDAEPWPEVSLVRRVLRAEWHDVGDGMLRFEIRANAFCHNMVRSIVGTIVEVGTGRRHAGEMMGILRARSRAAAGAVAPPQGLCLWEVGYRG